MERLTLLNPFNEPLQAKTLVAERQGLETPLGLPVDHGPYDHAYCEHIDIHGVADIVLEQFRRHILEGSTDSVQAVQGGIWDGCRPTKVANLSDNISWLTVYYVYFLYMVENVIYTNSMWCLYEFVIGAFLHDE